MTWLIAATVAAGGTGAAVRFVLDGWLTGVNPLTIPLGTLVINVSGSFALGLAAAALATGEPATAARTVIGAGFLAGYTTFSTASAQNADLVEQGRPLAALAYGGGMYAGAILAAAAGLGIGSVIT